MVYVRRHNTSKSRQIQIACTWHPRFRVKSRSSKPTKVSSIIMHNTKTPRLLSPISQLINLISRHQPHPENEIPPYNTVIHESITSPTPDYHLRENHPISHQPHHDQRSSPTLITHQQIPKTCKSTLVGIPVHTSSSHHPPSHRSHPLICKLSAPADDLTLLGPINRRP